MTGIHPNEVPGLVEGEVFADRATRQVLGVEKILELAAPDSEPARKRWFAPTCLTTRQDDAHAHYASCRTAQLRFESWWLGLVEEDRQEERIRHALAQMPLDLARIINKIRAEEVLAESELFAIKRFLYHASKLMALALPGLEIDRPSPEEDRRTLEQLLDRLHPEPEPSPRFFLADALDPSLAHGRKALVEARRAFMARRKVLVEGASHHYPGVRFDLDGEATIVGEQAIRAATDPGLEPRGSLWRLRDQELDAARLRVTALEQDLERYEFVVRQRLSVELGRHVSWLVGLLTAVTSFDLRLTRMRLRERIQGSWAHLCTDTSEGARVILQSGDSPLIEDDQPTQPIDFEFSSRPVIITGPNMGGKSSLLRLVGLCQWCMQHGLPVPARRYEAPLMRHLVYVGSDLAGLEQGATEGLSSFGREIRRLVVSRKETRPVTLWLLDEVGRGTHPEDGTLLAMEILDTLQKRGDLVICATHFPGLAKKAGVERWRIAGLVDRDRLMAMADSSHLATSDSFAALDDLERALRAAMDYRPVRLSDGEESVPRDAHLIARLLGW